MKEQVEFFKEKLEFDGKVETAWISGKVVVAKLGREIKTEVMKKKSKLAGSRIFIENDLNYGERKRQEEIYARVKEKWENGLAIRSGQGKILFKGKWYKWEDKEELEKEIDQSANNKDATGSEKQTSWHSERNDKHNEDLE